MAELVVVPLSRRILGVLLVTVIVSFLYESVAMELPLADCLKCYLILHVPQNPHPIITLNPESDHQ